MIKLTFVHDRDVFHGPNFKPWIYKLFPSAKFDGFKWGQWYPTIKIPLTEWNSQHRNIPAYSQKKIAELKCEFNTVQVLATGTYPVWKITNLHPDFEKITGRENYGVSVEEIIKVPRGWVSE